MQEVAAFGVVDHISRGSVAGESCHLPSWSKRDVLAFDCGGSLQTTLQVLLDFLQSQETLKPITYPLNLLSLVRE